MILEDQLSGVKGATVYANDGSKIGKAGDVYLDDQTGQAAWLTVATGLFGTAESFVPLTDATMEGDDVRVPYAKDKVKDAPRVSADGHLDLTEEDALFEYYGMGGHSGTDYATDTTREGVMGDSSRTSGVSSESYDTSGTSYADTGRTTGDYDRRDRTDEVGTVGHDTSGPTTDDAMTRSEETLRVGTTAREAGRARLRKRIVTEQQTVTVPVSHEEVTLEREAITDANRAAAGSGPDISEEEHEVILREEVPVVSKETHAVERVRVGTKTVTEDQQVTDEVRKEQIEVDGDTTTARGLTDESTGRRARDQRS